jgi:class 3 adenylate cyclase/tetratricopeptide (TPR) repeat protein
VERVRRRLVSVLFADLVSFTALAERLDPEDVAEVQERYFTRAREAVERHGGEVEKFIGDAVVGAFGVRDHAASAARRAVGAAVDLRTHVTELRDELSWLEPPLEVRIGVATGEVVVHEGEQGWRLTGDTVNVAARLQAAASPGEILVGPETMFAVDGAVALEELGPLELRNRSSPLRVWRVAGTLVRTGSALPTPPLVGRERELRQVQERLSAGARGTLLVAAPGLGRSRFLLAVAAGVPTGRHALVARAAHASAADPPYGLVSDVLDLATGVASARAGDGPTRPGTSLSSTAQLGVDLAAAARRGTPLEVDRDQLFRAWTAALDEQIAGPWLLIVDDLHEAAPDARRFVDHLVTAGPDRGQVLAATRPAALVGRSSTAFGDPIHLRPLSSRDTGRMIDAMLGAGTLPAPLRRRVTTAAAGTPAYVVELLRRWLRDGVLRVDADGRWKLDADASPEPDGPDVPSTIRALYTSELDELPGAPRELLSVASVPGARFPAGALPSLGVADPDASLRALVGAGLLRRSPQPRHTDEHAFRHPLLRDVAYGDLLLRQRAELHLAFARWLDRRGASDAEVAVHLEAALRARPRSAAPAPIAPDALEEEAAARHERAAGRHLTSAPERAADHARRAVELGARARYVPRVLLLAEASRRAGALEDARLRYLEAIDAAREDGDGPNEDLAVLGHERVVHAARVHRDTPAGRRSERLLDDALDRDDPDRPATTRAQLLAARGQARSWRGDEAGAVRDLRAAVDTARAAGDPATLAIALLALRAALRDPGRLAERTEAARGAVVAAEDAGDGELRFEAERLLFTDLLESGDGAAADEMRRRSSDLALSLRVPGVWWYPAMWEAMWALRAGDTDRARLAIERFATVAERTGYRDAVHVVRAQSMQLAVDTSDVVTARTLAREAVAAAPERWWGPAAGIGAAIGDDELAATGLRWHLERDLRAVPDDLSRSWVLVALAEAASSLDDRDAAAMLLPLLDPWRGHTVVIGAGALCTGSVDRRLALLERTTGDVAAARRSATAALSSDGRSGSWAALRRSQAVVDELDELSRRPGAGPWLGVDA